MAQNGTPTLVQALFSFKGKNNDELCFKKGDVITVTQREDGGWWEGTLAGLTGWFPLNYVKEYKTQGVVTDSNKAVTNLNGVEASGGLQDAYKNLVLKDLVDSEKAHVAELHALVSNFLQPLQKSEILTKDEYRQLVGNMDVVVEVHNNLLTALEAACTAPPAEQKVGRIFLNSAPTLKAAHLSYCASHPRAVCILNKHKDALNMFMEVQGAASPGLLVLTTGLSKPFRRLEKYTGMLQELERHLEDSHADRGDTQRSVPVYKDIWCSCSTTRRQKEQELEVLTGGVRGWEGEELSSLGEILQMGSVAVGPDHRDRYFVLFPTTLLILSVSTRMSGFIYEGKLPLSGIQVIPLPDSETVKNVFEITGPLIERIVAVCQTREEQQSWVDSLRSACGAMRQPEPEATVVPTRAKLGSSGSRQLTTPWTITSLKPLPPLRPKPAPPHSGGKVKTPLSPVKSIDNNFEEDIQILRVIEGYSGNSSVRTTMTPGRLSNISNLRVRSVLPPHLSMASKERYVLENIDLLRSQMCDMTNKMSSLTLRLDDEIQTRSSLQTAVENYLRDAVDGGRKQDSTPAEKLTVDS